MKNVYLLLCAGIFSRTGASAQAYLGQTEKGKAAQAAAAVRLPLSGSQIESGLKAYFAAKGYSPSSAHGFIVYRDVALTDSDREHSDLYFATSGSGVKDATVLTLVPAKKNQDVNGAFVDSSRLDAARVFLDSLEPYITNFGIGLQVTDQQDALRKAQKKLDGLRNDSTDYESRLRDLQANLTRNKSDQVKAAADLQTYIGADNDTKGKYQKRLNKLIDRQGVLEKKIRNTQGDLADKKADIARQQSAIGALQQALGATKDRQQMN